jgi:tetratricopeptide (TPR) repeat protein
MTRGEWNVMKKGPRTPLLYRLYQEYLEGQDAGDFGDKVCQHYAVGTLERLATTGGRMTRRAAVLALGLVGDYASNATLGQALCDSDRGVRMLAENGIRVVWCRVGSDAQRQSLAAVIRHNAAHRSQRALDEATRLVNDAPWLAEAWNQRAVALFSLGRFAASIRDCNQTLDLNPYHFGAASGIGRCHLQLGNPAAALAAFRRALALNPNLEGVRAHALYLERAIKKQG